MDEKPVQLTLDIVYIGIRVDHGKKYQIWGIPLEGSTDLPGKERWFPSHLVKYPTAGGIYSAKITYEKRTGSDVVVHGTPIYQSMWPIKDELIRWQMQDRTVRADLDREKLRKEEKAEYDLFKPLEEMRTVYRNLSQRDKVAFLAELIEWMTR